MGAINFKTGDFLTLSIVLEDIIDEETGEVDYESMALIEEDLYNQAKDIINGSDSGWFSTKVNITPGYYEGFAVTVDDDGWFYYDDAEERKNALKEVKDIEKMLMELCEMGMVVTYPGWCTEYGSYEDTKAAIKAACKKIKDTIRNTPTWYQYNHNIPLHRSKATTTNIGNVKEGIA